MFTFEVPGIRETDVASTGDPLTVKGERRFDRDVQDESYRRIERVYGKFEGNIQRPVAVQADKVRARYRDGVLEVTLPKVEDGKPREIKIDVL